MIPSSESKKIEKMVDGIKFQCLVLLLGSLLALTLALTEEQVGMFDVMLLLDEICWCFSPYSCGDENSHLDFNNSRLLVDKNCHFQGEKYTNLKDE